MRWCTPALLNVIPDGIRGPSLPAAAPLLVPTLRHRICQPPLCSLRSQTRCPSSAFVRLDSPPMPHLPYPSGQPFRRVKPTEQMAAEILHGGVLNLLSLHRNRSNRSIRLLQNSSLVQLSMSRRACESASETRPHLPHNQTMTV